MAALALAACAPVEEPPVEEAPVPHLRELSQLPGWQDDASFQAYPALLASCGVIATLSSDKALGVGGSPVEWHVPCTALNDLKAAFVADTDEALRRTLEAHFVALDPGRGTAALVTGYYEPELKGSRVKDAAHPYPLYAGRRTRPSSTAPRSMPARWPARGWSCCGSTTRWRPSSCTCKAPGGCDWRAARWRASGLPPPTSAITSRSAENSSMPAS